MQAGIDVLEEYTAAIFLHPVYIYIYIYIQEAHGTRQGYADIHAG
jgi:hypothetical protein